MKSGPSWVVEKCTVNSDKCEKSTEEEQCSNRAELSQVEITTLALGGQREGSYERLGTQDRIYGPGSML